MENESSLLGYKYTYVYKMSNKCLPIAWKVFGGSGVVSMGCTATVNGLAVSLVLIRQIWLFVENSRNS